MGLRMSQWDWRTLLAEECDLVLTTASVSSLSGIPLWPGTYRRVVGPRRALRDDLKR